MKAVVNFSFAGTVNMLCIVGHPHHFRTQSLVHSSFYLNLIDPRQCPD